MVFGYRRNYLSTLTFFFFLSLFSLLIKNKDNESPNKVKNTATRCRDPMGTKLSNMSDERAFDNNFADYSATEHEKVISPSRRRDLLRNIDKLLDRLENGLIDGTNWRDYSVYTGTAGISLLYLHLSKTLGPEQSQEFLHKAFPYVEKVLGHLKGRDVSFLCGDAGPIAIAAVLFHKTGRQAQSKDLIKKLEKMSRDVVEPKNNLPDELLYGRVGYLYALFFAQHHMGEASIDKNIIKQVIDVVLQSGQYLANKENHPSPLMYKWHDSYYLGAAHGVSGILYMLMQARDYLTPSQLENLVRPSVDYLMTLQYPSGNYPSSLGSNTDKLVHWCHGAPGFVHMLVLAHQIFGGEKYLRASKKCCDVIWRRGLLKKGYGICHGPAGNAYAFLVLYRVTKEPIYLYRAQKFAEWCFDYGKHGARVADRPLSMFEGLAGTIYFLADLLNPERAAFPAFQLW